MTPLRQRLRDELTRRNYSPRTLEAYEAGVARFANFFHTPPDQLGSDHVCQFQLHLIEQQVSWSLFNQVVCALRFFYRYVTGQPQLVHMLPYAKRPQRLPTLLSPDEVRRFLLAVTVPRDRLLCRLAYGCGLRLSELLHLRVADIDGARRLLHVHGKGQKDRLVPLGHTLLQELRDFWRGHRPTDLFFPGSTGGPLSPATFQGLCGRVARRAGLTKHVHPHTLRHCYATHLLEAGVDVVTLQRLLGHANLHTTSRYLHLRSERLSQIRSPLELLDDLPGTGTDGPSTTGTR